MIKNYYPEGDSCFDLPLCLHSKNAIALEVKKKDPEREITSRGGWFPSRAEIATSVVHYSRTQEALLLLLPRLSDCN